MCVERRKRFLFLTVTFLSINMLTLTMLCNSMLWSTSHVNGKEMLTVRNRLLVAAVVFSAGW